MKSHSSSIIGQIVISKAGRDQGELYLVVGIGAGSFLFLADGRKRTIAHPKVKNSRHLKILHSIVEGVTDIKVVTDLAIRAALKKISPDKL